MNPAPTDTDTAKDANPPTTAPVSRQAAPVMDVVPPRPAEKFLTPTTPAAATPAAPPAQAAPPRASSEGLATPPPETEDEKSTHNADRAVDKPAAKASKEVPVKLKPASNSVAGIIAITVSVVTILAGLAVYAYLQSRQ